VNKFSEVVWSRIAFWRAVDAAWQELLHSLRDHREHSGDKLSDVARHSGLSVARVFEIEGWSQCVDADNRPTDAELSSYCKAVGVKRGPVIARAAEIRGAT